jgi:hypothetical protein
MNMKRLVVFALSVVLLTDTRLSAQTMVVNPSSISFTCSDHDIDDEHEVEVVRVDTGEIVRTMLLGDPPLTGSFVIAQVDFRSLRPGHYAVRVRVRSGGESADMSDPSPVWQRKLSKAMNVDVR